MPPQQQQQSNSPLNVEQFHNTALNVVELFTAAFSMPLDYILRPKIGSRYCNPTVIFLTWIIMLFVPLLDAATSAVSPLLLAARIQRPPQGLFDIADYSKLFAILSIIHGIRTWRRMFNLASEDHSRFEGPGWFFFDFLPKGKNFCFTRIVWEPAAVLLISVVLHSLFIFQDSLAHFLEFSALCLAMRQIISWYRCWMFLRDVLDASNDAPIIAKFVENNASQDELNAIHLSGLPNDLSPELRRSMAMNIARVMAPTTTILKPKESPMKLSEKQRNILFLVVFVFALYQIAPWAVRTSRRMVGETPAPVAKPSPLRLPEPKPEPVVTVNPEDALNAQTARLQGDWLGSGLLDGGPCRLTIQIHTDPLNPGGYSARADASSLLYASGDLKR